MIYRLKLKSCHKNDSHLDRYTEANIISSEICRRLFYAYDDKYFVLIRHDDVRYVYWSDIKEMIEKITDKSVKKEAVEIVKLYRGSLCLMNV